MINSVEEKNKLFKEIWSIADDLRGSIDGWDFKNFILIMIFYRYLSEKIVDYFDENEVRSGNKEFYYIDVSDETCDKYRKNVIEDCKRDNGFFIYPSDLFCNICKNLDKYEQEHNLNEVLGRALKRIEESFSKEFKGLLSEFDVSSKKLGADVQERNKKLSALIRGIQKMDLGEIADKDKERDFSKKNDVFGDAYEFLMSMYASNAGKSGGEFFTPQEVSKLLMSLSYFENDEHGQNDPYYIYDSACGSGSLLLKAKEIIKDKNKVFYGQEINLTTYNLCRMNMVLHDVEKDDFLIKHLNTLTYSDEKEKEYANKKGKFEIIVSNPPYSIKWEGDDNVILKGDKRFSSAGALAPKTKADPSFVLDAVYFLDDNGVASIICFPGVLYRSGAEQKIRQYLVDQNYIDSIIQLPEKLFFGTSIQTCIMVIKKKKRKDKSILFIDASNEFVKSINNNVLSQKNIENILDIFKKRKDIDFISKLVPITEIQNNDYDLSVSSYVEVKENEEKIDIKCLNAEIEEEVKKQEQIRKEINDIISKIQ